MSTRRRRPLGPRAWGLLVLGSAVALVGLTEWSLRAQLGLGDPPLLMADDAIQYLYRPSRRYQRFGHTIEFNAWSMRSPEISRRKERRGELRVLVLGDSVVNGGAPTDQAELATTLLIDSLQKSLQRPVGVGNISAGSWGPENILAYVRRFGTFDADFAFVVLSSHDAVDVIEGPADLPPGYSGPLKAINEATSEYLPRYVPFLGKPQAEPAPPRQAIDAASQQVQVAMAALAELLTQLKQSVPHVAVVLHHEKTELGLPSTGLAIIARRCAEQGVATLDLGPAFQGALAEGNNPYRDAIHPSALGQRLLASVLGQYVETLSGARTQ